MILDVSNLIMTFQFKEWIRFSNLSFKLKLFLGFLFFMLFANAALAENNNTVLLKRASELAAQNKLSTALIVLKRIKSNDQIVLDNVALLKGRIEFNLGHYTNSLNAYKSVSKQSENWLSSVEERAWSLIYLGKANEALADSHTLMSPLFRKVVGPEAFFVSAFAAYQVCDFTRVFEIIDLFKKNSREKIKSLEVGFKKTLNKKNKLELEHYSDVIQHLSLIEADSIQRMYLDQSLKGQRGKAGSDIKVGKYDLQFPYEENDVWVDEIDQLQVDAKNCPQPIRKVVAK